MCSRRICPFVGIENKGFFFGFYVVSTIFVRLFTSSLSDRQVEERPCLLGFAFYSFRCFTCRVDSYNSLSFPPLYSVLQLGFKPHSIAWTADLSHIRRGVGAGTIFIALEIGIMIGSTSTILFMIILLSQFSKFFFLVL